MRRVLFFVTALAFVGATAAYAQVDVKMMAMKFQWYVPMTSSLQSKLTFKIGTSASFALRSTPGNIAAMAGIMMMNTIGMMYVCASLWLFANDAIINKMEEKRTASGMAIMKTDSAAPTPMCISMPSFPA